MEGQGRGAEDRAAWGTTADPACEGPGRAAPRRSPAGGCPPPGRLAGIAAPTERH
jgi:hypothetical protein